MFLSFSPQPELEDSVKSQLKSVYDLTKRLEDYRNQNTLSKLIISDFDDEQIWQQIEIQNEFAYLELRKRLVMYQETANKNEEAYIGREICSGSGKLVVFLF